LGWRLWIGTIIPWFLENWKVGKVGTRSWGSKFTKGDFPKGHKKLTSVSLGKEVFNG